MKRDSADGDRRQVFQPGELIFGEGAPGDAAYIIERGEVDISCLRDGRMVRLGLLGAGEIFGEMALIDDSPRTATARATEETEVLTVSPEQIQSKLQAADTTTSMLLRLLLKRFRGVQELIGAAPAPDRPAGRTDDYDRHYAAFRRHIKLEQELTDGISGGQLRLVMQPIIWLEGRGVAGYEALIRWQHPDRGLVSPGEFVPVAEAGGLIPDLDRWLFPAAFDALAQIHQRLAASERPFLSVNLSGLRFADLSVVADLRDALAASAVSAQHVKVELTEGALIGNPQIASAVLDGLKELGLGVAIDDFGTGYSSLSYLHRFPIDTLKIDRSFVTTMLGSETSLRIVRIVGLAKALDMTIVAEGIENEPEVGALAGLECEYGQGYLFSKPLSPDAATEFAVRGAPGAA